jgi:glutamyl-tRNA(Gln) amidotransferase subunit E
MDPKKLGFRCGIEIHQQLEGRKLFCGCPTLIRNDAPHFEVRRKLRGAKGESEELDVAALYEQKKDKTFRYQGYDDTTCLVELDDEPPHALSQDALRTALQAASLLNCKIEDEIRVMRKTVVDGSNTSGFQRTALIARDGWADVGGKKVGIATVCLEEDSCMIASRKEDEATYNLSRLGVPLIEIATAPDIQDPQQLKDVAAHIGMILRSVGVKRGLGTIRQDVNVSISGGARVEIKGAQDLKLLSDIAGLEVKRQLLLIGMQEELRGRKLGQKDLDAARKGEKDVTSVMKAATAGFIRDALAKGAHAMAMRLPKMAGLLKKEEAKNQRLGYEFATYARLLGFGGVIHSDEDLAKYGFDAAAIRKALGCKDDDAFVISLGGKEKIGFLFDLIIERCEACLAGVPGEVRKAEQDGSTSYLRPMPGAARMYPETDVAPIRPDLSVLRKVELLSEKAERIQEHGLAKDLADAITRAGKADLFASFAGRFKEVKPAFIAETMVSTPTTIRRKEGVDVAPADADFERIFAALDEGKIAKDAVYAILLEVGRTGKLDLSKHALMSDAQLEKELKAVVADSEGLPFPQVIGKAMARLRGKADPKKVMDMLKKLS